MPDGHLLPRVERLRAVVNNDGKTQIVEELHGGQPVRVRLRRFIVALERPTVAIACFALGVSLAALWFAYESWDVAMAAHERSGHCGCPD